MDKNVLESQTFILKLVVLVLIPIIFVFLIVSKANTGMFFINW